MILWKPSDHQVTPNSLTLYKGLRKGKCFQKQLLSELKCQCQETLASALQCGVAGISSLCFSFRLSLTELLQASTQLFYLRDAHQGLCQQHGADSAIRGWGAEWRGVLYWKRTDLGFSLGFLPICGDYCRVSGP